MTNRKEVCTGLFEGDCLEVLRQLPKDSINLIMTSPPYADQRNHTYGGIRPDDYVSWFLPRSKQMLRVLKPTGSFILNIKERVVNGERHTYVLELILALRKQGWHWTDEYIWHKKNSHPGKWPNRFRDGWERCLHFTKTSKFEMYQNAVMVPTGEWAIPRLRDLAESDKQRNNSQVNSGFGKDLQNWIGRDMAYPDNVLHLATECKNRNHSAAFPIALPAWFIKLFTAPNGIVLDPFLGSGTTAVAASQLGRQFVGIEINVEFLDVARDRLLKHGRIQVSQK